MSAAVGVGAAAADDHCTTAGHAAPASGAVTVAGASGCVAAAAAGAHVAGGLAVLLLAGVQHAAAPGADMCTDSGTCNTQLSNYNHCQGHVSVHFKALSGQKCHRYTVVTVVAAVCAGLRAAHTVLAFC